MLYCRYFKQVCEKTSVKTGYLANVCLVKFATSDKQPEIKDEMDPDSHHSSRGLWYWLGLLHQCLYGVLLVFFECAQP